MRAKIAKNMNTHALDKRIVELDDLQLHLLYLQAVHEERDESEKSFELIKTLNEVWTKKFDNYFEMLMLFTNRDMYKQMKDLEEIEEHRVEINEDNFLEEWGRMMAIIPEEYIVDEGPSNLEQLATQSDPEMDDLITGWVETSRKFGKG